MSQSKYIPSLDEFPPHKVEMSAPPMDEWNDEFPKGAHREFDRESPMEKKRWFDQTPKTKAELREMATETEHGSLILKPAVWTNYLEVHLDAPSGAAKEATCNKCWNTHWVSPFGQVVECPYCHSRGINIHEKRVIDGE